MNSVVVKMPRFCRMHKAPKRPLFGFRSDLDLRRWGRLHTFKFIIKALYIIFILYTYNSILIIIIKKDLKNKEILQLRRSWTRGDSSLQGHAPIEWHCDCELHEDQHMYLSIAQQAIDNMRYSQALHR